MEGVKATATQAEERHLLAEPDADWISLIQQKRLRRQQSWSYWKKQAALSKEEKENLIFLRLLERQKPENVSLQREIELKNMFESARIDEDGEVRMRELETAHWPNVLPQAQDK